MCVKLTNLGFYKLPHNCLKYSGVAILYLRKTTLKPSSEVENILYYDIHIYIVFNSHWGK